MTPSPRRPLAAVGVVCLRADEVLLIRRGNPPRLGEWSLPGGKVEWGERTLDAASRELAEETGVAAEILGLIEVVDGLFPDPPAGPDDRHYVLIDYAARWLSGEPRAGDDAADARFWPLAAVPGLGLWSETTRIIAKAAAMFGEARP